MKNSLSSSDLNKKFGFSLKNLLTNEDAGGLLILGLVLALVGIFMGNRFYNEYNIFSTIRTFCFMGMAALGEAIVIMIGGIDLSVGAVACFSGIVSAWLMANTGINPMLALLMGTLVGLLAGLINGLLITKAKINSFIVTLGTMQLYFSLSMIITQGWPITNISRDILWIGQGKIGFLPIAAILFFILVIILELVFKFTAFGRKLYSIGNNDKASFLCGVNIDKTKIIAYSLSGFFASMAGVTLLSRLNSGQPTMGNGWELQAIAAVIIGGGSLAGGTGSAIGTFAGAAILGIVSQLIVLLNISSFWQRVVIGAVIIIAVLIDLLRRKLRK